jgi:hypothetical protein
MPDPALLNKLSNMHGGNASGVLAAPLQQSKDPP